MTDNKGAVAPFRCPLTTVRNSDYSGRHYAITSRCELIKNSSLSTGRQKVRAAIMVLLVGSSQVGGIHSFCQVLTSWFAFV
jgi:hypothetical protein